jgi:hypothetical protein
MSDTRGQHTNGKDARGTREKKDPGSGKKAAAGASGRGSDNTGAGSGGRGGHRRRRGQPPEGSATPGGHGSDRRARATLGGAASEHAGAAPRTRLYA